MCSWLPQTRTLEISPENQNCTEFFVTITTSCYICQLLKDRVTRFFLQVFFHESSSHKPLQITVGSFQIFSKILGVIRKWRCTTGINDTSLPQVSTTPVEDLPPVSTTPAANFVTGTAGVVDTGARVSTPVANLPPVSLREQYQTADTLKWTWRKITLLPKGVSKKIIKTFLIKDFLYLPPVSTTPVVHI